jgi:dipeptidyl aminopeptidase/acylaminoacyl peptidase
MPGLALAALALAAASPPPPAPPAASSPLDVARRSIGVRQIANPHGPAQFAISADGKAIAYVVTSPRADGSAYSVELFAGAIGARGQDRLLATLANSLAPFPQANPRFSPDGRRLALLAGGGVDEVDLGTGDRRSLTKGRVPEGSEVLDFSWSPDGARLALRLSLPAVPEPAGGREMPASWPLGGAGPATRLAILDASGPARIITGPDLDVAGMSWSPDGQHLALAASPASAADRFYAQDIYLADLEASRTRLVASLDGVESEPAWSPDGRHLAFATQAGEGNRDWLQVLGILDSATGAVSFPAKAEFEAGMGSPHDLAWSDGDHLIFTSAQHLRSPIFELSVGSGKLRRLSPLNLEYLSGLAVAGSGRRILFGCEAIDRPRALCISPARHFAELRVTNLNPGLELPAEKIRIVSWKSADRRWNLDGVLVEPAGRTGPVPTVALIEGGPSMVRTQFELEQQYPVHAFVAAGYAVFLPNTRGRSGYSRAFRRSIAASRDYVEGGFGDLMSGLDRLVAMGVADPARLGVAGFSYGGVLSAYAIGRTHRFAAASILDAPVDLPQMMKLGAANPAMQAQWRDQVGYSDPYNPADRALMEDQSPLARAAWIKTPALLEYGLKAFGGFDESGGAELSQALKRFDVPSLFIRYPRTGHGIYEPGLRLESARRNLEWFGRWLGKGSPAPAQPKESSAGRIFSVVRRTATM